MAISVEQAREALVAARSEAADADRFQAQRLEGGWCFFWDAANGDVPTGTSPWLVADNGVVRQLGFRDDVESLLAALNAR